MKMYVVEYVDEDISEVYHSRDKALREITKRYFYDCSEFYSYNTMESTISLIREDLSNLLDYGYIVDFAYIHEVTVMDEPITEETENG